ncbi:MULTISPECIES: hypothetical protein [unclassified Fibrobacter]|uniref:hypothetical protein n=1 Tax=unclassified Fibrobacter TaxID=2634177 RepID=UPI001F2BE479|nr:MULTISPECIES: hypothetical protein [unclassified Fibrobacter]
MLKICSILMVPCVQFIRPKYVGQAPSLREAYYPYINGSIESEKTGYALQKTGIALQKMEIASIVLNSGFGKTIKEKMKKIIDEIDENQVIAAKDIMKILACKPTAATEMIKRMRSLNLLKKIEGVGPGRYSLNFLSITTPKDL